MNIKRIFINSSITSLLVILDRLVMYFIPLYYWGVETTALWVTVRSFMFLLSSIEGGVGQSFSKKLNKYRESKIYKKNIKENFTQTFIGQIKWWVMMCVFILVIYYFSLMYFNYQIVNINTLYLLLVYAGVFYINQILIYFLIGVGLIVKAYKINNFIRVCEISSLLILPIIGFEIYACLISMIILRASLALRLGSRLKRYFLFTSISIFENSNVDNRLGYFLFPVTPAIYNFIPIMIFNYLANPVALLNFMISRLFGRINIQLGQIFHRVIWPILNRKKSNVTYFNTAKWIYLGLSLSIFLVISICLMLFEDYRIMGVELDATLVFVILGTSILYGAADIYISSLMSKEQHKLPLIIRNTFYVLPIIFVIGFDISVNEISLSQYYFLFELIFFIMVYKYDSSKPI